MLLTLHVRDFVIVQNTELQFEPGFTVFSGETGAGKSILIDALALALGGRADTGLIRAGAQRADITAVFSTPPGLTGWLTEQALDPTDELILRRTVDSQGRSRAFINGQTVPLTHLRSVAEHVIDIHGQHAHQSLLKAASQRELLDTQGNHLELASRVNWAWRQWQQLREQRERAEHNSQALAQERERLAWQLGDLDRLAMTPGEWETLSNHHSRLAHAQALLEGCTLAMNLLDTDDAPCARQSLNAAHQHLQKLVSHDDTLRGILDTLESARIAVAETVSDLAGYLDRVDLDPESLAHAEQRLSAIFETARKYKIEPQELPGFHETLRQQLHALQSGSDTEALRKNEEKARAHYQELAAQLSQARQQTAALLSKKVTQAMQSLAMAGGRFEISVLEQAAGPHGTDAVEFLVAGHPGTPPRPLAKVASGGELARISLALSVIASQAARVPTLIFDEVDTGIGGGVAEVVGRLLKELGQRHQVLCVTHLPQVAACGDHHFRVAKQQADNETVSSITALSENDRVQEVARMLGGLEITRTTLDHAREMLTAF